MAARFPAPADAASPAAADYRRQIEAKQAAVASALANRHIQVTSRVSHLSNALFVSAAGHHIAELLAIPGVKSVTPMRRLKANLNRALQLMDAQTAWNAVNGQSNAGKGIKIGILDSGIDLTNPAFQDSSLTAPSGFPVCSGFPIPSGSSCASYTNGKVIVARSYMQLLGGGTNANPAANAGPNTANSSPDDPFPHDRNGHGTAAAMIAAGNTITSPAVSTGGSPITLQGMAPKAYIGVYKVAGSFGYTNEEVVNQALEDALTDGMNVIYMPYGALALTDVAHDSLATAFEAAAKAGGAVIVVAAGNDGSDGVDNNYNYPSFNTINSPSNAPDVISVGATTNSHIMQPNLSVVAASAPSNLKNIVALPGDEYYFFPSDDGANTAPLVDVSKVGDPTACTALPQNSLLSNGVPAFALIAYSTCGFDTPALNAQNAGAVGYIYILPAGTAVAPFDYASAPAGILEFGPAVSISAANGMNLENYIDANPGQQVTIDVSGQEQDVTTLSQYWLSLGGSALTANMVSGFSSFGPTPDGQLKPDIVATGGWDPSYSLYGGFYVPTQTYDAYDGFLYSANGFMAVDGTSYSAALVAGAAALAIQAHPGLRGTQVRSLIVNSATQTVITDDSDFPVDAQWLGAGMLDAGAATNATLTAEPATVSFGILQSSPLSISKTIAVTNLASNSVTLSPKISCCTINGNLNSLTGATVAATPSSFTLAAGASSTVTVSLYGTVPSAGEYSGSVTLGGSLRIPFMMLVGAGTNCSVATDGCNIEPNFTPEVTILEGPPSADTGLYPYWQTESEFEGYPYLQVVDPYGVPVAGASVTFTASPAGSLTLNGAPAATGHPACTPASATMTITCTTDQFGWAWMDAVLGTSVSQPTITYAAAGFSDFFSVNIQTPPAITVTGGVPGVGDAAAGQPTLIPGAYESIYGTGLSDVAQDLFALQCPTGACAYPIMFDGVSVSFDVPGASYPGFPYFVTPTQINLVVPWELQGQTNALVKVSIDGDLFSNVVKVPIAASAPAFFGCGTAVCALDYPNYNVITTNNPAKRGQYIQLYANGLGPVTNTPGDGAAAPLAGPLAWTTTTPVVMIGGAQAQVTFNGLAPGYPALYQINVQVPQNAQTGSAVPISVQIGGATSPAATIPVQ